MTARKALGALRALPDNEEARIQNSCLARYGASPGVLLLVNTVKVLPNPWGPGNLTFGLGEGSPDVVGSVQMNTGLARACGWEFKRPGEKPEPHQARLHDAWRALGWFIAVVHSEEEFEASLERARSGEAA